MRTSAPPGRRERAMADKRRRIMDAARSLFVEKGVDGVTTQQIADEADVAIGTLFRYAASKAELLMMVQNEKFTDAVDEGVRAARASTSPCLEVVMALLEPVIHCVREHPANGRVYLHELVFGDPSEVNRAAGLAQAWRLESAVAEIVHETTRADPDTAAAVARVVTAVIHVTMTATLHLDAPEHEVHEIIRTQLDAILPGGRPHTSSPTERTENPCEQS